MTPEQRAKQKVIDSIRTLTNHRRYTLGQIEKMLGIPTNTLSTMLNGNRNMGPKYVTLLSEFLKALPKEDKTITIKISDDELDLETALAEKLPPLPEGTLTDLVDKGGQVLQSAAKQTPPAGLTKSQQIRWHRENSQTLL